MCRIVALYMSLTFRAASSFPCFVQVVLKSRVNAKVLNFMLCYRIFFLFKLNLFRQVMY